MNPVKLVLNLLSFTGYYCPQGSGEPTPCPVGTFNNDEGMGSVEDCIDCPINHFNHLTGQDQCFSCGGEAEQPNKGQKTCTCSGAGRDFQVWLPCYPFSS